MTTEYRISSTASANERFVLAQYMFVLLIPALLAIIIFGHVAEAAAPIKHMVSSRLKPNFNALEFRNVRYR